MKLASCMSSVEVRPMSGGIIEVRPKWTAYPAQLTRMAVAAEIARMLERKLPRKGRRG